MNQNKQEQIEQLVESFEDLRTTDYEDPITITDDESEMIKDWFREILLKTRQEAVEEFEKTLNGWFEENFHYPKVQSDDAYVTEKQLYDFIKALSLKKEQE